MKTVTIPTCANPFVVIVNGIKYTYPAGATMEVPDDVAEVIEQHEEAKTEPAPVAPPFAAAPSSGESGGASGGGGLPVIALGEATSTSLFSGEDAVLTADEQAAFETAAQNESSVEVRLKMAGITIFSVICCYINESNYAYLGTLPSATWGGGGITQLNMMIFRFIRTSDNTWNGALVFAPLMLSQG